MVGTGDAMIALGAPACQDSGGRPRLDAELARTFAGRRLSNF